MEPSRRHGGFHLWSFALSDSRTRFRPSLTWQLVPTVCSIDELEISDPRLTGVAGGNSDRGTGLILRFDSHWECESTVVVCQHPSTKQITVMVAGLSMFQTPRFLNLIRTSAAESPHLLTNLLFVPLVLLSELCQNQTDWLELVAPDLNDIQRALGMGNWKYASDSPLYGPNVVENLINLDLPGLMSGLNRMADSIRFQNQVALTLIDMLHELQEWLKGNKEPDEHDGERRAREEMDQTIALLSKSLMGCQRRVKYRSETIQGLMDTVRPGNPTYRRLAALADNGRSSRSSRSATTTSVWTWRSTLGAIVLTCE